MMRTWQFALSFAVGSLLTTSALASDVKRTVISLGIPGPAGTEDSTGGIIVADLTGDGKPDYLVTCTGHLAAYDNVGSKLWIKKTNIVVDGQSESQGLPGHHGPGVAAGDVDGDRRTEVVFLTKDGVLHIVDGAKGGREDSQRRAVRCAPDRQRESPSKITSNGAWGSGGPRTKRLFV